MNALNKKKFNFNRKNVVLKNINSPGSNDYKVIYESKYVKLLLSTLNNNNGKKKLVIFYFYRQTKNNKNKGVARCALLYVLKHILKENKGKFFTSNSTINVAGSTPRGLKIYPELGFSVSQTERNKQFGMYTVKGKIGEIIKTLEKQCDLPNNSVM